MATTSLHTHTLINFYLLKIGNVQVSSSRPRSSLRRYLHLLEHRWLVWSHLVCTWWYHPRFQFKPLIDVGYLAIFTRAFKNFLTLSLSIPTPFSFHRHTYLTYLNRWLYFVTKMFQKLITFGINGVNLTLFQLKLGSLMLRPVFVLLKQQACRRYIWTPNSSRNFQTGFTNVNDAIRIFLRLLRRREKTLGLEASCQQH